MQKNLALFLVAGGLLSTGQYAKANSYTDLDVFNPGSPLSGILVNGNNPLSGTFNIVTGDGGLFDKSGYNPSTETITSATATFSFRDDHLLDPVEKVIINLGNLSSGPVTLDLINILTGSVLGSALVDLDATGILSYKITANTGDFIAMSAELDASSSPRGVPDGGSTLVMLGLACVGFGVVGRKFQPIG